MQAFTLRKALPTDISACVALLTGSEIQKRYYPEEQTLVKMISRSICEENLLWLAVTQQEEIAGILKLVPKGFCGIYPYISLLAASENFRGQGVARFLVEQAAAAGKQQGARKIALMVSDFNSHAKTVYQHLGFYEVGLLPNAVKEGIGEYLLLKDIAVTE